VLVLAIGVPLLGLFAFSTYQSQVVLRKNASATALVVADIVAGKVAEYLDDARGLVRRLAEDPAIRSLEAEKCETAIRNYLDLDPRFSNIVVTDSDGRFISRVRAARTTAPLSADSMEWFRDLRDNDALSVNKPFFGRLTGAWVVVVGAPVRGPSGKPAGYVGVSLDLVGNRNLFSHPGVPEGCVISVVAADGTVLTRSSDADPWLGVNVHGAEIVKLALARKRGSATATGMDGVERFYGFTTVLRTDWYALAGISSQTLMAESRNLLGLNMTIGGGVLLAVLLLVFSLTRRIEGPVRGLADAAHAAAVAPSPPAVQVDGSREIRQIANDLSSVAASRDRARSELEASEERLALAVEAGNVGIWDWNILTNKEVFSPGYARQLGYEPEELPGHVSTWESLVHPDDLARALEEGRAYLEHPWPGFENEFRMRHKDGSYRHILARAKVYNGPDGKPERMLGTHIDLTERLKMEQELREAKESLEVRVGERTADLEAFTYSVSHDLRAPLRAIAGFSEIISRRHRSSLSEEGSHYLDNVIEAAKRMSALIEDLLEYSRLGRTSVACYPVNLGAVVAAVVREMSGVIEESGGGIAIAEDLPTVSGNATLLGQVFSNLFENAFKFRRDGIAPEVRVTWRREGRWEVISVSDNGIGIPSEFQSKVFSPFSRLHNADQIPGTGVGLAIVRKAVSLMGGKVWLDSGQEAGATFSVRLAGVWT
jgi:PAS domain S-box-containing protein